jgi:hypothetical protein
VITSTSVPHPDARHVSAVDKPAFRANLHQHVISVCDVWVDANDIATIDPGHCRPLVCTSDAQCPKETATARCLNGICGVPGTSVNDDDATVLCLAGTGAPSGTFMRAQTDRSQLADFACRAGTACQVPAVCRQP